MKTAELNIESVRKDFPILRQLMNGRPLVYLDNGATAQKPLQVLKAIEKFYKEQNANIHRGVHLLSQEATVAYEKARETVQKHINAAHPHEIIFTSGTTESVNLVAHTFAKKFLEKGDEILITEMEHHSNILPWQVACEEKGAVLKVAPVNDKGELIISEYEKLLTPKTKIVAIAHVSNTLGTINPVQEMIQAAHEKGIPVLIDGAQAIPHMKVDVRWLDADFYCFSGHKVFGPTGIGVLYGKEEWLNKLPNYKVGGGTIRTVTFKETEYGGLPIRFEAGTPNIDGVIGMAAALDYINGISMDAIHAYEHELLVYATERISGIKGVRIIGTAAEKAGVLSFVVEGMHPLDIGMLLDAQGVAVRTGHHCTQPLMERFKINGTVRASLAFYNTKEEIDVFAVALIKALQRL